MLRYLLPFTLLCLVGCESKKISENLDSISEQLKKLQPAKDSVETATKAELEKLWTHEYKVEEVPASMSSGELEEKLMTLGRDRWDCFHIEKKHSEEGDFLQIYCKRRPESYLRYIPRWIP